MLVRITSALVTVYVQHLTSSVKRSYWKRSSRLPAAPRPELRPLQVLLEDVGPAAVALCDQAQLFQLQVPPGLIPGATIRPIGQTTRPTNAIAACVGGWHPA